MNWNEYYIKLAMLIASKSKDPSTQVGCVIVGPDHEVRSTGFNGFPRGVQEMHTTSEHRPMSVNRNLAGNEYTVYCSCGDTIGFPVADVQDFPYRFKHADVRDAVLEITEKHEHFVPPTLELSERWERPAKYEWVEHAERNAIYNAARTGVSIKGCTAYLNWEPRPCVECCKGFIQAGIINVVGPNIPFPSGGTRKDWKFDVSTIMMNESGVGCREVEWSLE